MRLRKLLFLSDPQGHRIQDLPIADSSVSDLILTGDYESAAKFHVQKPLALKSLMLSAKARVEVQGPFQPGSGIAGRIAASIEKLVSKHHEEEAALEAERLSLNFRFCSFIPPFVEFVADAATDTAVVPAHITRSAFIYSNDIDPHALYALDDPCKESLASVFSNCQRLTDKSELFRANVGHTIPEGLSRDMTVVLLGDPSHRPHRKPRISSWNAGLILFSTQTCFLCLRFCDGG